MRKLLFLIVALTGSLILLSCGSTDSTTKYQITISTSPSEGGTVSPSGGQYEEGSSLDITATPSDEYRFVEWQGDYEGTSSSATITVDGDKNIQAIFIKKEYALTVNSEGKGTVDESILQTTSTTDYESGTIVELTANPAEGWKFVEWQGDITSTENPAQITVDEAKEVTAVFEKKSFAVNINTEGEGSITKNPDQENYTFQSNLELEATPAIGYQFVEWQGDIESTENPVTVTVDTDPNFTSVFKKEKYSLTVNTEGEGIVTKEPDQTEYAYNSTVNLTANAAEGWKFVEWQGAITSSEKSSQITINEPKEVTAVFEQSRTKLEGIISSNTTLTSSGGPYQITGRVQVAYGSTLKLEPGVVIYGNKEPENENNVIEAFGTLLINGQRGGEVILRDVEIQPSNGKDGELFVIEIQHMNMIGGKFFSDGQGNNFGSFILKDSFLYEVNMREINNNILYRPYYIDPKNDFYMERNIFYNVGNMAIFSNGTPGYIENNLFYRNNLEDIPDTYKDVPYAVKSYDSSGKIILRGNTFSNTKGIAIGITSYGSMDAKENYWGTTSKDKIESMIHDRNDDLEIDEEIPFEPFLNNPDSDTPILPDSLQ